MCLLRVTSAAVALAAAVCASNAWGQDGIDAKHDRPAKEEKTPTRVRTDRKVYPEPKLPTLPKAGGTFVDPTFGTRLLRVTDEADGKSCHNAYAYWPTFNKDATRFHINCGGTATLYHFDPDAFKITGKGPLFAVQAPGGGMPNWEDATWSGTDPTSSSATPGSTSGPGTSRRRSTPSSRTSRRNSPMRRGRS